MIKATRIDSSTDLEQLLIASLIGDLIGMDWDNPIELTPEEENVILVAEEEGLDDDPELDKLLEDPDLIEEDEDEDSEDPEDEFEDEDDDDLE